MVPIRLRLPARLLPYPIGHCGAAGLLSGLALALVLSLAAAPLAARVPGSDTVAAKDLPREARDTLALIHKGGPFPLRRDGTMFGNREGRLPPAPRGAYREYTVPTPGARDRGARRIIARDGRLFWYTDDHYRSFRRIVE
ncbi:MAG TPA: ribonuclease domain-containing protein [Burkholderiales bacterium]|nr:ribonuclease domain-containing protein [Burkholderiales bacterium]